MEDKLTNTLIVFILIIVLGLAGIYFYKIAVEESFSQDIINNQIQENNEEQDNIEEQETVNTNIEKNDLQSTTQVSQNHIVIEALKENNQGLEVEEDTAQFKIFAYDNNNRYYYNQLDSYSKILYDAIADNIGDYNIEIDYDFTSLLNESDGRGRLNSYYDDAINAINLDIPNLFYIDFSKMYLQIEATTTLFGTKYKLYIDSGENSNYFNNQFTDLAQVEKGIKEIENVKNQICGKTYTNEYAKAINVHDWMIEKFNYNAEGKNKGNVYGALVEKNVVCEGYARAYKYILDELGVTNILVIGAATNSNEDTEDHMWNYVKLNDKWYAVDVTWDDPIIRGNGVIKYETKHKYFLIGSDELFKTHVEQNTISSSGKIFKLPVISTVKY